jgi:hypothetical protein
MQTTLEQTGNEVVRWRRERLVDMGFSRPLASRLAKDARYDLHALIELVEHGCRPDLAVRILAPDDEENGA